MRIRDFFFQIISSPLLICLCTPAIGTWPLDNQGGLHCTMQARVHPMHGRGGSGAGWWSGAVWLHFTHTAPVTTCPSTGTHCDQNVMSWNQREKLSLGSCVNILVTEVNYLLNFKHIMWLSFWVLLQVCVLRDRSILRAGPSTGWPWPPSNTMRHSRVSDRGHQAAAYLKGCY